MNWLSWVACSHEPTPPPAPPPAVVEAAPLAPPDPMGEKLYADTCQTCHGADGKGMAPAFPPLVASPRLVGDPAVPIRIVLHGLQGPLEVGGVQYDGVMTPWGRIFSDAQVAAVLTHARQRFGPAGPVTEADVARVREEERLAPWTAAELTP